MVSKPPHSGGSPGLQPRGPDLRPPPPRSSLNRPRMVEGLRAGVAPPPPSMRPRRRGEARQAHGSPPLPPGSLRRPLHGRAAQVSGRPLTALFCDCRQALSAPATPYCEYMQDRHG